MVGDGGGSGRGSWVVGEVVIMKMNNGQFFHTWPIDHMNNALVFHTWPIVHMDNCS